MEEKTLTNKLRPAILWARDQVKYYHPIGGASMTAALNLWHILRESPIRHGCCFDLIYSYKWAAEKMLKVLLERGWMDHKEIANLWDEMVLKMKVSHHPEDHSKAMWATLPHSLRPKAA